MMDAGLALPISAVIVGLLVLRAPADVSRFWERVAEYGGFVLFALTVPTANFSGWRVYVDPHALIGMAILYAAAGLKRSLRNDANATGDFFACVVLLVMSFLSATHRSLAEGWVLYGSLAGLCLAFAFLAAYYAFRGGAGKLD